MLDTVSLSFFLAFFLSLSILIVLDLDRLFTLLGAQEFQKIIQSMNLQSASFEVPSRRKTEEMDQILKEMRSMKESLSEAMSSKSERTSSEYSAIVENMRKLTQRHNEVARIVTDLPSSMQSLKSENSKICKEIANMNASYLSTSKLMVPPSPSPPIKSNEVTVQTIKALITRQIEEMKRQFVRSDGALKANLDKLLQKMNSGNVSLFNNLQKLHGAQRQQIVDECGQRTKSAIDSHQSVLKEHLLAIQKGLKQFNQTQLNMKQAISTGLTPTKSSVPPPTQPLISSASLKQDFAEILGRIQEIVGQQVSESNSNLVQHINKLMVQKQAPSQRTESIPAEVHSNEMVKEMMSYIRCNLMKEVQLIKNLCNDIHKKSEQLPHIVARSKDLRKFEQKFVDFTVPNHREVTPNGAAAGGMEANQLMTVLMMQFNEWMESVMSRISRNRNECSLYVVVYVLSQIAFCSFVHRLGDDDDEKMEEREAANLEQIQSAALSMLRKIERKVCDDEVHREELIDDLMETMRSILSENSNLRNVWISRAAHSVSHWSHSELQRDRRLSVMKETLDRVLRKQSNTCWNMAICQPLIFCSSVFVVLFGVWLQSIWTEQNIHH